MLIKNFAKNKIVIGTVNFGIKYGVNKNKIEKNNVIKIINHAINNKINTFDTASSYGTSECLLGQIKKKLNIITKINTNSKWVNLNSFLNNINKSFEILNTNKINTILFHDPGILKTFSGRIIFSHLNILKKKKIIQNVGVSIYDFSDLNFLLENYSFDIIQCPFNVLDRRLVDGGYLKILKKKRVKVHVRSIFLQGLLVNKSFLDNPFFFKWKKNLINWFDYLNKKKIRPTEACISHILDYDIDKIVIGVSSENEINDILNSKFYPKNKFYKILNISDKKLTDPRLWKI
jgi:aryl-alcohol dehydrogenase-like predicted oxidoreductase